MSDWRIWFKRKFRGIESQALRDCKEADTAYTCRDYKAALPLYEESLKRYREIERWDMVLLLRIQLGTVARLCGDYPSARTHLEQAVSLARNQKQEDRLETALTHLGLVAAHQGEYALAKRLGAECLSLQSLPEKALGYAATQCLLGSISESMSEAMAHFECALEIYRENDNLQGIRSCLCSLGHCTEAGQDNSRQRAWLQECLQLCEVSENESVRSYVLNNLGNIDRFEGSFDNAMERYRESLELKQLLGDEWAIAYTIEGCAGIAAARCQGAKAARLLGKAFEIRERLGAPLEPRKQPEYEAVLAQVRELVTPTEFEMAWEEGKRLSLTHALMEATAE
jgi:tetratricopeptide (TPR) repeat protein